MNIRQVEVIHIMGCFKLATYIIYMSTRPQCRDTQKGNRLSSPAHRRRQVPKPSNLALPPQGTIEQHQYSNPLSINRESILPQDSLVDELEEGPYVLGAQEQGHVPNMPNSALRSRWRPDSIDGGNPQDELGGGRGQQADPEEDVDWENDQTGDDQEEENGGQLLGHLYGYCNQAISSDNQFIDHLFQIRLSKTEPIIFGIPLKDLTTLKAQIEQRGDSKRKTDLIFSIKVDGDSRVHKRTRWLGKIKWLKQRLRDEYTNLIYALLLVILLYFFHFYFPIPQGSPLACSSSSNSATRSNPTATGDRPGSLTAHQSEYCQKRFDERILALLYHLCIGISAILLLVIVLNLVWKICWIWRLKRKIDKL